MGNLIADVECQMLAAGIPDCAAAARLDRHVRLAGLAEACLDDAVGRRHALRDVAGREGLVGDEIAGQAFIHERRARLDRGSIGEHRWQRFVVDDDRLCGILGDVAIDRDDAGDGIALEADLV